MTLLFAQRRKFRRANIVDASQLLHAAVDQWFLEVF